MKFIVGFTIVFLLLLVAGLSLWRMADVRYADREKDRLLATRSMAPATFSNSMVADLPEPARRYFQFAIAEGTPLYTVARISMTGRIAMGTKEAPNYTPMTAEQLLAAPEGFVWEMSGGAGLARISGSDTGHWTRFWLGGLIPVARMGGTDDHALSAFGRYASEAIFWTPAAVLPLNGAVWERVDDNTARVTLTHRSHRQSVDLVVGENGQPVEVVLQRWSNANTEKTFRFQPFGGTMSEFRRVSGFQIPTHVEAGNLFGTDAYFPFFIADVTSVRFE